MMATEKAHKKSASGSPIEKRAKRKNCRRKVQIKRTGKIKRRPWTDEEDDLVVKLKENDPKLWAGMGFEIPDHKKEVCSDASSGKTSTTSKSVWTLMTYIITHRSPKQIKERYTNHLAPGIKKGDWSSEETDQLRSLHEKYQHLPHK